MAKRKSNRNHLKQVTREASASPIFPVADEHLDISALETWLWDAACAIRGATDAPKFKDFILPLIFYKRLSDVFDDEFAQHVATFGDEEIAALEREAAALDELFRALLEKLMTGQVSARGLMDAGERSMINMANAEVT